MRAAVVTAEGVKVQPGGRAAPAPRSAVRALRAASLNRAIRVAAAARMVRWAARTCFGLDFAGEVAAIACGKGCEARDRSPAAAPALRQYAIAISAACRSADCNLSWEEAATLPSARDHARRIVSNGASRRRERDDLAPPRRASGHADREFMGRDLVGRHLTEMTAAQAEEYGADLAVNRRMPIGRIRFQTHGGMGVNLSSTRSRRDINAAMRCTASSGAS